MLYYIGNIESFHKIIKSPLTFCLFTASWCKPCQTIKPIFIKLANDTPSVNFVIIDTDSFISLSEHYFINSVPSILLFKNNTYIKKLDTINSFNLKNVLENNITKNED